MPEKNVTNTAPPAHPNAQPTHPEIFYWLATTHLAGIGARRLRRWIETLGGHIERLFTATQTQLQTLGCTACDIQTLKNIDWHLVEQDANWCDKINCHLITDLDARYPTLLREIDDAPLLLFVRGDVDLLTQPQLAIVGSRNPTRVGSETAERFAQCLAKAGIVVTSGMALGIDAASHKGALLAKGKTIAVTGTGLQNIYPASNRQLAEEIMASGALVSEFYPGMTARAQNFPMRNRVISGMSMGVLVVEAAIKSGSLITARFAVEQNRDVFAIPGSIHNPMARGCHQLIQQGAKLIETTDDILAELGILNSVVEEKRPILLATDHQEVLNCIDYGLTTWDAILRRYRGTASFLAVSLLDLELTGHISTVAGGYMRNK